MQDDKRAGTVGFALTILQRRLAFSPEVIYQSLRRRLVVQRSQWKNQIRSLLQRYGYRAPHSL